MPGLFSKIVSGEISCYKIAEDERYLAFLDINPLVTGHTLVIPKRELDYIFDLDDETYSGLMLFAKKVSAAVYAAVPCKRIGVAVIGLEVPHVHVHLVPLNHVGDINFSGKKMNPLADELENTAALIRSFIH